ncbi:MAG: hypothetical protein ACR2KL_01275 [Nocardioidaceae bacterium]
MHLPAYQRSAHYRDAWVGYDVAELVALIGVGITAMRGSRLLLHEFALLAGVLLTVDAWFDVMTAPRGFDVQAAFADAFLRRAPAGGAVPVGVPTRRRGMSLLCRAAGSGTGVIAATRKQVWASDS